MPYVTSAVILVPIHTVALNESGTWKALLGALLNNPDMYLLL
jgi:hypothetical protein